MAPRRTPLTLESIPAPNASAAGTPASAILAESRLEYLSPPELAAVYRNRMLDSWLERDMASFGSVGLRRGGVGGDVAGAAVEAGRVGRGTGGRLHSRSRHAVGDQPLTRL